MDRGEFGGEQTSFRAAVNSSICHATVVSSLNNDSVLTPHWPNVQYKQLPDKTVLTLD